MDKLVLFNDTKLDSLLNKRPNETKFGEHITTLTSVSNIYEQLKDLDVTYVVIGLPEDVGVFANYGKTGTSNAFEATIKILLNIQSNQFTNAKKVLVLGHLDFKEELEKLKTLDQSKKKDVAKARKIVSKIDKYVTSLVHDIVKAGKKPIIIGGGHNNAYGNIKGTSLALKSPINAVNFDAHTDFRDEEGRHSGNGFSYAFAEGFLKNYFVFGLHENYTSSNIFSTMNKLKNIQYNTYEDICVRKKLKFKTEMERALEHVASKPFGIEIDCDAIQNTPSSAMTPSGFSLNKARNFINYFASHKNASYLHICEAAPTAETETQIGKLITYLITDFIKANA
ncbi:formimidoylglutamase [Oceanihabitans sediminis]|uniref:Arginase n=1 Tax=Oceanihabitans sediminis TaxID=1812012 RepID=A0A368P5N6_9FLAO|nr:formimidoylglutamase [Oceanihabitans sediminis]MDX1277521.1 formimidoylglutamase [Oceanihabitans sediminis]MDX1773418.1 formimidoylglutamase [Oceanihabitans sediminis]RBP32873.1 formiminoglutamase [Oceanihabitans sediminis]RCU57600.1 arginase [Oceanihabitans sediminis]